MGVASPFSEGGAQPDLAGRQDRLRPRRARQDGGRVHPGTGQGAHRTCPRRRRRHPPGRSRRAGRGVVPDGSRGRGGHRPHRRGPDPAAHLRLRGGDGVAAAHRSLRPRHGDRARRAAAPGRGRPGLGGPDRGDGRDRRRYRLRAPHRHPVPQQPRRRTRPTPCDADRDRNGRTSRRLRRPHRRGRDAGHPPGRPTGAGWLRLHRVAVRAGHHDRLADAVAGAAGLRRTQHRTTARAVRGQEPARLRHHPLVPLEPIHPEPAVDRRDRCARRPAGAGGPLPRHAVRVPRRPERPEVLHDPPGLRPDHGRVRTRLLSTPGAHRPRGIRQRAAYLDK